MLFAHKVIADVINYDEVMRVWGGPIIQNGVLKERGIWTQTGTLEAHYMKIEAEIWVILLEAKDGQRLQQTTRNYVKGVGQILSHSPQKEPTPLTPRPWTCSLLNCEIIYFYYLSHPVYSTSL